MAGISGSFRLRLTVLLLSLVFFPFLAGCGGGGGGGGGDDLPSFPSVQASKVTDPDSGGLDYIGYAVAASGEMVLAGAYNAGGVGAAVLLAPEVAGSLGTWRVVAKFTAGDAGAGDQFGLSVAMGAGLAIAGANFQDGAAEDGGAVYVFAPMSTDPFGTWLQAAKLTASDAELGDQLGYSVSVYGERILAGARGKTVDETAQGAAYLFATETPGSVNSWVQVARLTADNPQPDAAFGHRVVLGDKVAAAGAFQADGTSTSDSGAVYIFAPLGGDTMGTWVQTARLTAADANSNDNFGSSLAMDGEVLVVGAYNDDQGGQNAGAVYVFAPQDPGSFGTWVQVAKLMAGDPADGDRFGYSVSISGDVIAVGARQEDDPPPGPDPVNDAGAVYIFVKEGGTWIQAAKLSADDAELNDNLGYAVAVSGNLLAAGAPYEDDVAENSGAIYIFKP